MSHAKRVQIVSSRTSALFSSVADSFEYRKQKREVDTLLEYRRLAFYTVSGVCTRVRARNMQSTFRAGILEFPRVRCSDSRVPELRLRVMRRNARSRGTDYSDPVILISRREHRRRETLCRKAAALYLAVVRSGKRVPAVTLRPLTAENRLSVSPPVVKRRTALFCISRPSSAGLKWKLVSRDFPRPALAHRAHDQRAALDTVER